MTIEEALKVLKDGRKNLNKELDQSVQYEQQHTLVALDMAIKSLEAWEKVRAEIKCLTITKGGEDYIRKMAELFALKTKVLQIIDKHLAEVS